MVSYKTCDICEGSHKTTGLTVTVTPLCIVLIRYQRNMRRVSWMDASDSRERIMASQEPALELESLEPHEQVDGPHDHKS